MARNVEIKARIENVALLAPKVAELATEGPLELAHLVRRQSILEEESCVVFPIPTCLRCQTPDLGGSRQAHPLRYWERKVVTEELTQGGMTLSRP